MTFCQRDSPSRFPWSLSNFLCPPSIFSTHLGIKLPFLDSEQSVRNLKKSLFFLRSSAIFTKMFISNQHKGTLVFELYFHAWFLSWVSVMGIGISSKIFDRLLNKMRGICKYRTLTLCDFYYSCCIFKSFFRSTIVNCISSTSILRCIVTEA